MQVGIAYYNQSDTFISQMIECLKGEFEELEREGLEITVMMRDAAESQRVQDDQVKELIGAGCDVLCVNLVDRADPSEIIDFAREYNVPIIFFNREPVAEDLMQWDKLYYVGADAKQSGIMMGISLTACGSGGDDKPATDGGNTATEDQADGTGASDEGSGDTGAADDGGAADSGAEVANKDKPLVWFNRQPSNSSTGELDMTALSFNKDTYYVGFDANQGAELQGTMVKEYIEANIDSIDRNGDGVIGYVLAIGDIGHNDSIARTRGVRKALGTGVEKDGDINSDPVGTNTDGSASAVQDGSIEVNGKTYIVRELASQEMKNSAGATWDAATAGNAIGTWSSSFGDSIDIIASNNDGMGMSMFNAWSKDNKVPTFGYDANSDAVAAIAEGYGGTISQHADVQAYLTLRVLRNALDGVDIDTGIGTADDAGNVLSEDVFTYNEEQRSYYALNVAVTADNYKDFTDSTKVYEPVANQLDAGAHPSKKVWLNIYNASDNFLSSTYQPLLQSYDDLMNLEVDYIGGDGQTESNITNRLGNPGQYDAFAINMVKTDNSASYTALLNQ